MKIIICPIIGFASITYADSTFCQIPNKLTISIADYFLHSNPDISFLGLFENTQPCVSSLNEYVWHFEIAKRVKGIYNSFKLKEEKIYSTVLFNLKPAYAKQSSLHTKNLLSSVGFCISFLQDTALYLISRSFDTTCLISSERRLQQSSIIDAEQAKSSSENHFPDNLMDSHKSQLVFSRKKIGSIGKLPGTKDLENKKHI